MAESEAGLEWEQYKEELAEAVASQLELSDNASLLCLGGGDWQFGQRVATKSQALHFIYADDDEDELAKADDNDVLTTYCTINDVEQISTVGKYDAVVMKNSLERVIGDISSLEEFFLALYKALKLNGKAVVVIRISPGLPLPDNAANDWKEKLPSCDQLVREAEQCGFECSTESFSRPISLRKSQWREQLEKKSLPFMAEATADDIEQCMRDCDDPFTCTDHMQILALTKVIT